jgi:hypothetical protein
MYRGTDLVFDDRAATPGPGEPNHIFDDFNRPDALTLAIAQGNDNWAYRPSGGTGPAANIGISANTARIRLPNNDGRNPFYAQAKHKTLMSNSDGWVKFQVATQGSGSIYYVGVGTAHFVTYILARTDPNFDYGVGLALEAGNVAFVRRSPAASGPNEYAFEKVPAGTFQPNDGLGFRMEGNTLFLSRNGTEVMSANFTTNNPTAAGAVEMMMYASQDNFGRSPHFSPQINEIEAQ